MWLKEIEWLQKGRYDGGYRKIECREGRKKEK